MWLDLVCIDMDHSTVTLCDGFKQDKVTVDAGEGKSTCNLSPVMIVLEVYFSL